VRYDLSRSWRLAQTKQALQMEFAQQHAPELVRRLLRVWRAKVCCANYPASSARVWPGPISQVPLRQFLHGDTLGHNEPINP
jgi:hypothetical protein